MKRFSPPLALAALSSIAALALAACGGSDTILMPAGTGGAGSTSGVGAGLPTSTSASGTSSTATSSSGAGGGSNVVTITQPGELALPGARFYQNGRFLAFDAATGNPPTATKVKVFDVLMQKTLELGDAIGACANTCEILPMITRVSRSGSMAAVLETLPNPPTAPAWSIVDLTSGTKRQLTFGTWYEHPVVVLPNGGCVTVKQTFQANPGAILYYPPSGSPVTLTATNNDPDSLSGIDAGMIGDQPVVVAAVFKNGANTVDVYPLDGSGPTHLGTGNKVWVVGDRAVFFDMSSSTTSSAPLQGGAAVKIGAAAVALDMSDGYFPGPSASPDQKLVLLEGVQAVATPVAGGASTPTMINSYESPQWLDAQTVAFGRLDQMTNIQRVFQQKLTDAAPTKVADDAKLVHAGPGGIIYGANTPFKPGSINVTVPMIPPLSMPTGELFDGHVVDGMGDRAVWTKSATDLAASSHGVAVTRFVFDPKNNAAPAADDGLYYVPLP